MEQKTLKQDVTAVQSMIIPKGTVVFIERILTNPMTKKKDAIVRVDNGTGHTDLMPKELIKNIEEVSE